MKTNEKRFSLSKLPNAYVILFVILLLASAMTYLVPSGEFQRKLIAGSSKSMVIPGSYHVVKKTAEMTVNLWDMFNLIIKGMIGASPIMLLIFLSGGLFKLFSESGSLERGLGAFVQKVEKKNFPHTLTFFILTFIFGCLAGVIGFENSIPFVPLGVMIALGLGYDIMTGASLVIASITIGFGTSPLNPYTVGTADKIAGLPMFSGIGIRAIFFIIALTVGALHTRKYAFKIKKNPELSLTKAVDSTGLEISTDGNSVLTGLDKKLLSLFVGFIVVLIYGVIKYKWSLEEMCALFVIVTIVFGLVARWNSDKVIKHFMIGVGEIVNGALIVGFARGISEVLMAGHIQDTLINGLANPLAHLSPAVSAIGMSIVQGVINVLIPSGSGQAMATLPIIFPLAHLIGISPQVTISAFQIGDGFINLCVPTLGGLMAMLAVARVPFDKWIKFVFPLIAKLYLAGWTFLIVTSYLGW